MPVDTRRLMKNRPLLSAATFVPLAIGLASLPRSHVTETRTAEVSPTDIVAVSCDPEPMDASQCHDVFPTGCTDAQNPSYDAYLNFLKNQRGPFPGTDSPLALAKRDFENLEKKTPPDLTKGNHSDFVQELKDLGEGQTRAVIGYLYYAQPTGAETCNCKLTGEDNVDYHIGVGFAKKAFTPGKKPSKADQQASVVVEMTPHTRTDINPNWTNDNLQSARGKQVKAVGQLIIDNEHNNAAQNCGFAGAKSTCWRLSAWELHPVTQFLVCKTNSCDENSPDSDWAQLGAGDAGAAPRAPAPGARQP